MWQHAQDIWTYQPPWMWKYLLAIAAVAVLLVAVPVANFRLRDHSHHDAYLARREREARLANLQAEGFALVGNLPAASASSGAIEIRARPSEQQPDGAVIQHAAIVYPESVTRFTYAVLAGHSVWRKGSAELLEGGSDGVAVDEGLRRDFVESLVKESDRVICVGLASSEPGPDNTRLADDRAVNLCRTLHNIGFADPTRQRTHGFSLGEASADSGAASRTLQRSVILVGVMNARRVPRPNDIVEALAQLIQVPGVSIASYQRTYGPPRRSFRDVRGGELTGADGEWQPITDGSNPFD